MNLTSRGLFAFVLLSSVQFALAHPDHPTTQSAADLARASAEMAAAGLNFYNALTPDQQQRARYDFTNDERLNWAFVPKTRNGLPLKDMTPPQRAAALALLKAGASQSAITKVDSIMNQLEIVLRDLEKNPKRDPSLYFVTLFGKPEVNGTWAWRFEGHHVAFNFTIVDGTPVGSPVFLGANPATVKDGPNAGLRVLASSEDLGRKLITSLSDDQRKLAIFSETAPKEITTSNSRKITPGQPAGIPAANLTPDQKQSLHDLLADYANRLRTELADDDLNKIEAADFNKVFFAWAGPTDPGKPHYYRIQGPTFMIEYDDTQNNANHIHTVWRDPANDFGEDLLKQHYLTHPHDHD